MDEGVLRVAHRHLRIVVTEELLRLQGAKNSRKLIAGRFQAFRRGCAIAISDEAVRPVPTKRWLIRGGGDRLAIFGRGKPRLSVPMPDLWQVDPAPVFARSHL